MMMTPLRRPSDPNRAREPGLLRDGNVPHAEGFMEWAGLFGNRLYADYEFLYGRHWRYFKDQEHARAAVELVLSRPEQVQDMNRGKNASFVGRDEITGTIYRVEIEKKVKNRTNYIRSVFQITSEQYQKIKLEPSRVLQPSPAKDLNHLGDRTISSFLRYDTSEKKKVKSDLHKKTNASKTHLYFKDISLMKMRSLYAGQTENPNANLPADRTILTIHDITEFVNQNFRAIRFFWIKKHFIWRIGFQNNNKFFRKGKTHHADNTGYENSGHGGAEARTIAAKAREIADDMPTYIDLVTRADKQGDRWAAENAVCAAERNSEYIQELVNGIQETGQKNVSAEKPKIHV